VCGPHAAQTCQRLTTNDVRVLTDGRVQYTLLCREDGGVVDDVTLYRVNADRYFFCVNASNIAKDLAWILEHAGQATVVDRSDQTALIALQGPTAVRILDDLTPLPLPLLRTFRFARTSVAGHPVLVSRTGYTGEDGFELYVDAHRAVALWSALFEAGRAHGLEPIGLGARDTLRLEAALALYGNELDDETSPLAAGLARFVKLDGDDFIGRAALLHELEYGVPRRLVGLVMRGPGIGRHGYAVTHEGAAVGVVTSGTHSPTRGEAIALAYVEQALATPGTMLAVDVRGRAIPAEVGPTPFYRRAGATTMAPAADGGQDERVEPVTEPEPVTEAEPATEQETASEQEPATDDEVAGEGES
jgi:aminomethyltransferase